MPIPFVAAHNDLTMANLLQDRKEGLGVLDWETASETGLPLTDLYYALVDAVVATDGNSDRLAAFESCFSPGGEHRALLSQLQQRIIAGIGFPGELSFLCLHACWLQHAVNESNVAAASDARPFLQIVQWLALHSAEMNAFMTNKPSAIIENKFRNANAV